MENEKDENTEALIQLFPFVPALEVSISRIIEKWRVIILFAWLIELSFQFFVFLSLVDFGRTAVNPFGSDQSDIDVKSLLRKHVQVKYYIN